MDSHELNEAQAGWHIADWCKRVSISRAGFYLIPADQQPATIQRGRRRIVIESPQAWLRRMHTAQRRVERQQQQPAAA